MIKNEKLLPSHFAEGCVHVYVKEGKIQNAFCHLPLPDGEYILHLKVDGVFNLAEFIESHPFDSDELKVKSEQRVYILGPTNVQSVKKRS